MQYVVKLKSDFASLNKDFLKINLSKIKTKLDPEILPETAIYVSLAEAVIFLSCDLSRDSVTEVSRDPHSEGCQSILCKSGQKCARFDRKL